MEKLLKEIKIYLSLITVKKRRKGYRVKNGHRQAFTQIEIQSIVEKGATSKKANATTFSMFPSNKPITLDAITAVNKFINNQINLFFVILNALSVTFINNNNQIHGNNNDTIPIDQESNLSNVNNNKKKIK